MGIFTTTDRKCPQCATKIARGARFCPGCGAPQGGANCPACGAALDEGGLFCTACGADLKKAMAQAAAAPPAEPRLKDNRWARLPGVLAQRIEGADVEDLTARGAQQGVLVVEPGVSLMLFQQGKYAGVLKKGTYAVDELRRGWFSTNLATGVPTTAIMVEDGDIEVPLELAALRTLDFQDAQATLSVLVQVQDPEAFLVHLMRGRDLMTRDEMKTWLEQEVQAVVAHVTAARPARDYTPGAGLRPEVESELRAELGPALARCGLGLVRLRFINFACPQYDRDVRAPQAQLEIDEERRRLQDRTRYIKDVMEPAGDLALAEERQGLRERAAKLGERVRELENKEFITGFQSRRDVEDYVAQVEHESGLRDLLRRDEQRQAEARFNKSEMDRGQAEHSAQFELDKSALGRAHALDRLRLELSLEQQRLEGRLTGEMNEETFQRQAALERLRLEQRLSQEKLEWMEKREQQLRRENDERERKLADRRNEAEAAAIELERDRAETELSMMLLEKTREASRRHRREEMLLEREQEEQRIRLRLDEERQRIQARLDEEERRLGLKLSEEERRARLAMEMDAQRARLQLEAEQARAQLELERERVQGRLKIDHLAAAAGASVEALMATAPGPAAEALARREEMKAMATMSADQLMALAAGRSPELARAMAEKFKAEGTTADQQAALLREFMERLERKNQEEAARQDRQRTEEADRLERMTDRIERLAVQGMSQHAQEGDRVERIARSAMDQLGGAAQAGAARSDKLSVLMPGAPQPAAPQPAAAIVCRTCRRDNPAASLFCQFCGAKLS